ncbi:MAG TPA: hypothetical protein VF278_12975 [Pirellulales bacterium]
MTTEFSVSHRSWLCNNSDGDESNAWRAGSAVKSGFGSLSQFTALTDATSTASAVDASSLDLFFPGMGKLAAKTGHGIAHFLSF